MPHAIPETIKAALEAINKTQAARISTWEDLSIGGKYIIKEIATQLMIPTSSVLTSPRSTRTSCLNLASQSPETKEFG
jgi:hypothetical protein